MHGHEHDIIVLVCKLHDLMHPSLVILHAHKSPENADSIIYMHNIVTYGECCQVIYGKLLALFHRTPYAHPVETVENLMVTVAADLVVTVYESVVYIAAWNELRHDTGICGKYGTQPFKLGLLFPVYSDLIAFFKTLPYVFRKQFEILVEDGLRRNIEFYRFHVLH